EATDAVKSFTSAIQNAPRAFLVGPHRFAAQDPVPLMDTGGIVEGPGLFMVGAGVREIVRYPDGNSGETTVIHVEVHGHIFGVDEMKRVIAEAIEQKERRDRARQFGSR